MTNTQQDYPLLETYKKKRGCRIFLEEFLIIAIPFTVVVGGVLLIVFL